MYNNIYKDVFWVYGGDIREGGGLIIFFLSKGGLIREVGFDDREG